MTFALTDELRVWSYLLGKSELWKDRNGSTCASVSFIKKSLTRLDMCATFFNSSTACNRGNPWKTRVVEIFIE